MYNRMDKEEEEKKRFFSYFYLFIHLFIYSFIFFMTRISQYPVHEQFTGSGDNV